MSLRQDNKRIAKNTLFLYIRMLLIMLVSLYTVRVILQTLGASDYGIYNAVGGIVAMMSFISSTMSSASLRFYAYELGRKDYIRLNQYFNVTIRTYLIIGLGIIAIAETIGLWFVKTQMVIPSERMSAALWVYQFSILSFFLQILMIPYNALILAREKMNIYAYVSIIEVILKLVVVYVLMISPLDKLKLYAVLICCVNFLHTLFYIVYSRSKFEETKIIRYSNSSMTKEVLGFSSWNMFGTLASVCRSQGVNILLNVFFSPVVNASRAIAYQVNSAVAMFVTNFYTAVRPQITKLYATGEIDSMMDVVFKSSRFCYFLAIFLVIPVIIQAPAILDIWLGEAPEYSVLFTRLVLVLALVESIGYPFHASVAATGNIKNYQITVGGCHLLTLPISYILFKFECAPAAAMVVSVVTATFAQFARIYYMKKLLRMPVRKYFKEVIEKCLLVTLLAIVIPVILHECIMQDRVFCRLLIVSLSSFASSGLIIYTVGMTSAERILFKDFIRKKIFKR